MRFGYYDKACTRAEGIHKSSVHLDQWPWRSPHHRQPEIARAGGARTSRVGASRCTTRCSPASASPGAPRSRRPLRTRSGRTYTASPPDEPSPSHPPPPYRYCRSPHVVLLMPSVAVTSLRCTPDVNAERAEDVVTHQSLLEEARDPQRRPALSVCVVQVQVRAG
ncbi:hypothetical protein ZWY2020_053496 [Hordeum vulgare]|nr:hypothetical protein ZWY2020_053496 [Hordeum vulgare]